MTARGKAYRGLSISNDAKAWSTGDPEKIAKRYVRKALWRTFARLMGKYVR